MEADEAAEACPTYEEGSQRTGGEITMAKSHTRVAHKGSNVLFSKVVCVRSST
jgi:hypothetical protein